MVETARLSLEIKQDGHPGKFQTLSCPARKPLIDVVRPMFCSKLPQPSVTHVDRVHVKLDITEAASDISWSSPAHRFEVRFVFIKEKKKSW